jgi:putative transposase
LGLRYLKAYNGEHRHSGIRLLTPADVHHGRVDERRSHRRAGLHRAWAAHPERFVHGRPERPALPPIAWINRPEDAQAS